MLKIIALLMILFSGLINSANAIAAEPTTIIYRDFASNKADWDSGYAQVTCAPQDALTGLSADTITFQNNLQGHAVLCTQISNDDFIGRTSPIAVLFQGSDNRRAYRDGDWDTGNFKLECGPDEYVIGVSQSLSTAREFHGIQCAKGIFSDETTRTTVRVFSINDARGSAKGGDWDYHRHKGQCADDEYIVGVSFSPQNKAPHALLCSTSARSRGQLKVFYNLASDHDVIKGLATENGRDFLPTISLPGTTANSPAVAAFNGRTYFAFKNRTGQLCVKTTSTSIPRCNETGAPLTNSPAAAVFKGRLYIAFKSTNLQFSNQLCMTSISSNGIDFSSTICRSDILLSTSPAMTAFNGKLYVTFIGLTQTIT